MTQTEGGESSFAIKKRVDRARQIQVLRYRRHKRIHCNGQMGPREIKKFCQLDVESHKLIEEVVERLGLSARSYHRILKISRTIADLAESADIVSAHVAEAVQYRRLDRRR